MWITCCGQTSPHPADFEDSARVDRSNSVRHHQYVVPAGPVLKQLTANNSMNCVLYARVSTDKQADKELSIPAQLQAMREHAHRHGWTVINEYLEPGASARTADRPVLQQMLSRLKDVVQPRINVVLVHKIDRLARNVYDHATIKAALIQQQVRLASVVENTDDSVSGQLVEHIMASIAQFYSANLGEETKKGMKMLVERGGWPHRPPRGYRLAPQEAGKRAVVTDPIESAAVRYAFETYATGIISLNELRQLLAERGFKAAGGGPISLASCQRLLLNSFYAGRVRWHGIEHPGRHTAIVTEELFRRVQAILIQRHRHTGEKGKLHFSLRGIAVCSGCGRRMTAERHGRWSYYRCISNATLRGQCSARFSNVQRVHEALAKISHSLVLTPELRARLERAINQQLRERQMGGDVTRRALISHRASLQTREAQLTDAYLNGELSAETYRAGLARIRTRILAANTALADGAADPVTLQKHADAVLGIASSLGKLHDTLQGKAKARLLAAVFTKVVLDGPGVVGFSLRSPFDRLLISADGPPRHALEDPHVRAAISSIFELDLSALTFLTSAA